MTLEEQTDDKYLAEVIADVRSDVEGGVILSKALARHPKVFNRLFVAMVEAGESSGTLDTVLDRVAVQIEKETQIKRRVKGAMVYPTVVISFAFLVLTFMLLFIIPVFVKVFDSLDGELPKLTQIVMHASYALRHYWFIIFPAIGGMIYAFRRLKRTEQRTAGLGPLQAQDPDEDRRRRAQDRARALLAHARDARRGRRRHHQGARDHRRDRRATGSSSSRWRTSARASTRACRSASRCRRTRSSRRWSAQMVKIGEETGELDGMLGKVADFYEDEVDSSIQSLTSIIEPILMIGVGVMVGHHRDLDVPADVQDAHAHQVGRLLLAAGLRT